MLDVNFLTTSNQHNGYGMTREYFKKFLLKENIFLNKEYNGQKITFILNTPPAIQNAKGDIKVLYTMIEGDTCPPEWVPYLEEADYVIVPSHFVQDVFSRVNIDTTVIPLGYDPELFQYVDRKEPEVYRFLHYEAFQDRKGWLDLLDAWLISGLAEEEFECQLVLKTVKSFKEVYERLESEHIELPYNVSVICGELPHVAMASILASVDCFVFPSRGEGFGLPPIEAMATGLPVIISKGHSHMEYFDQRYMYGVECGIKIPARYDQWSDQGNFVRCSVDDLALVLKTVYSDKHRARLVGRESASYIKAYQYHNTAIALAKYLCQLKVQQP